MTEEAYVAKCEELLTKELPIDTPDELMKAAAEIEAMGYLATVFQAKTEKYHAELAKLMTGARANAYNEVTGKTAAERQAKVDSLTSDIDEKISLAESKIKYYRNLSVLIDRRVGLAQSTLANMSAQIKAGIITR